MFRSILILYLFCFTAYIVLSRQPDYFDGDKSPAIIHMIKDSASALMIPKAVFSVGRKEYAIDARYFLREFAEGDKVDVVYESAEPDKAAVYKFWGYWITWRELLATFLIYIALFQIAITVTKNPTAESLIEQLEFKEETKRKYIE